MEKLPCLQATEKRYHEYRSRCCEEDGFRPLVRGCTCRERTQRLRPVLLLYAQKM